MSRRLYAVSLAARVWAGVLAFVFLIILATWGIGCSPVGPRAKFTRADASIETPSPVTLDIADDDKRGTATGTGPARYTSITGAEVSTFQSGTTPRDLFVRLLPDGSRQINLSSGTDIIAEGVEFDAGSGSFKVRKFGTTSSEPLRAGNEAYDRLVTYWRALSADQREARIAEIRAVESIAPDVRDMLIALLTGL